MSELEARLGTMLSGADQLQQSSERVDVSVQTALREVDSLLLTGYESPAVYLVMDELQRRRSAIVGLPVILKQMADTLRAAHDDIAEAVANADFSGDAVTGATMVSIAAAAPRPYILPPSRRRWRMNNSPVVMAAPAEASAMPTGVAWAMTVPFVAAVNRTLHEDWNAARHKLQSNTQQRDTLIAARDEQQQELNALSNRILAFDPHAKLETISQVTDLQHQIADMDAQIEHLDTQITATRAEFNQLNQRFQWVMPGEQADVNLISSMEHGKTAQIVLDNTQDCVNYVASRMAIPPGMATNAHLWNDNVDRLTQYGLKRGDVPLEGSVLVMEKTHPYAHQVYGHVMYVERVDERGVWITDNLHTEKPVLLSSLTSETSGSNISYVYFPWQTKA